MPTKNGQFEYPTEDWAVGKMAKIGPMRGGDPGREYRELMGTKKQREERLSQAGIDRNSPEMSREDTEKLWKRSPDFQKGYEANTMEDLKQQLDQYGEVILRKGNPLYKQLREKPLPDHDMMELNRGYMSEGMTGGQKDWFDREGGSIYIKRKPLTSEWEGPKPGEEPGPQRATG